LKESLLKKSIDMVTFTSSSTVKNFVSLLECDGPEELSRLMDGIAIAVIGPITAKTAEKYGLQVNIQPDEYTIPAMVEAIVKFFTVQDDG
jgi:uroporphyrinogen III methyltransferase/synthase